MMLRRSTRFAVLLLLPLTATLCLAQTSPLPQPTGYANDDARVINETTKQRLETTLGNLDRQQQIQFAVLTVETTNGQDIFDYSLAVARAWGIGAKDVQKPSLLLVVAIKDRKYFTQVSRHLEGDLPDGLVGQIQREHLVPAFRAGDYSRGLEETIDEYISVVAQKNGFGTDTIFAGGATPERKGTVGGKTAICPTLTVIIVIIVLLILFRRGGGRGYRSGGGSWLTWLLVNSLLNSGRRSSGWSGGGFGGVGGGSGGGFGGGGFGGFGGGGDFGGGGAGGSW